MTITTVETSSSRPRHLQDDAAVLVRRKNWSACCSRRQLLMFCVAAKMHLLQTVLDGNQTDPKMMIRDLLDAALSIRLPDDLLQVIGDTRIDWSVRPHCNCFACNSIFRIKLVQESESLQAPEDVTASQDGYPASTAHGESWRGPACRAGWLSHT